MHFDNISSSNQTPNQSLNRIILNKHQAIETEFNQTNPIRNEIDSSVSLFFLWITILNIVILALVKILHKLTKPNLKELSIFRSYRLPCRNCKFFNKNEYLKCAVNPYSVLRKQAIDCPDYCYDQGALIQDNSKS